MRIIVDAMGGDNAPDAIVRGALAAHSEQGVDITLVGRAEDIRRVIGECGGMSEGIEIVDAREVVEICDDPATAFKKKKDSSLTVGLTLLRDGAGDAFVSAGSTGALLAGATLLVKRIHGIRRAAMAPLIPTLKGKCVLCDCGANAECTPEYLLQFAYLGQFFARHALGVDAPRVGLLNIGAEPSKGDALRRETYAVLQQAKDEGRVSFVGNVEAKEALLGACDVLVSDGFSGNVMLKTIEGAGSFMGRMLKGMFLKSVGTKLAALMLRSGVRDFKRMLDPNEVGGTAFIGISKPVIKAHGSSNAAAIKNAVRQASEMAQSGFIDDVSAHIDEMKF